MKIPFPTFEIKAIHIDSITKMTMKIFFIFGAWKMVELVILATEIKNKVIG